MSAHPRPEPRATYRLQLRPDFGLDAAAALVPYLAQLGISHVYLSPYLQAARDSSHGYDVVDPGRVNEALGGEAARRRLVVALAEAGIGQLADIVPNHMAIIADQNPWWWDVLQNGPSSRYALYFDVDWDASEERWPNKVLLPVLQDHYGRVLEAGELRLRHDHGLLTLRYGAHSFPVDPSSWAALLTAAAQGADSEWLAFIAESCARLPRPTVTDRRLVERRHRDVVVLQQLLLRLCREVPAVAAAIDTEVVRINADPDALDRFIEQQNYRLALWRTAGRDLGYRRFFDINDLAGLRVEVDEVFEATHALPVAWYREGAVHGLRIDHADGLREPAQYFQRLRRCCPEAWIVAEKVLSDDEVLPVDWPIAGTTGYDFLARVDGLFVDPAGEAPLTQLLEAVTGEVRAFAEVARSCKHQILEELLGSELNRLTSLFIEVCECHRRHRDYTRHDLHQALLEVATCFPVYRGYVSAARGTVSATDRRYVGEAVCHARERRPDIDPELFDFLQAILLLRFPGPREAEMAMRFQQLTGPAMAKGVEDTALYRYHRLLALNEVGGNPGRFGYSVAAFHRSCARAREQRPQALLASSTHDTKRGEDLRARLLLLSEIAWPWAAAVQRWRQHNARHRQGGVPDAGSEYFLYQTLVGAWPIEPARLAGYMEKAMREAGTQTSWLRPQAEFESALKAFVHDILRDREFLADAEAFIAPLIAPGRVNSLAATLLKLCAPGVPDIYQGAELWHLSLVDPDNRRSVDFEQRAALLATLPQLSPEQIQARAGEGLPKLWLIRQALHLRRERSASFGAGGSYEALSARGGRRTHVIAFRRGGDVMAVAPRLPIGLADDWRDTHLELPPGHWCNRLTGEYWSEPQVPLSALLRRFPVALLAREEVSHG